MEAVARLKERFGQAVLSLEEFRGETTVKVERNRLFQVLEYLKAMDEIGFDFLTDLCGVDNLPDKPRFQVVYLLYSFRANQRLRVKVDVPEEDPHLPSLVSLWKAANWLERETYDMYGIIFDNHPDLTRILMWEGFEGHPMRKDFPLKERDKSIAPAGA